MTYFSVVRANIGDEGRDREQAFCRWWAREHQVDYLAFAGFRRAWLLRQVSHPHAEGETGPRYAGVYEVEGIDDFVAALDAGPPWGPWQVFVDQWLTDWTRTYRKLKNESATNGMAGGYWAVVASDFDLEVEQRIEFERWYDEVHVPELLAHPGFHHAWRLELAPHPDDLGPRGRRYWAIYEVDHPDAFAAARHQRAGRGIRPWDGIWSDRLDGMDISFFEITNRLVKNGGF